MTLLTDGYLSSTPIAKLLDEQASLTAMLRVEAALAAVQAEADFLARFEALDQEMRG